MSPLNGDPGQTLLPRIGPYQLLREIGAGGMGKVFLAERVDEFHRQVALKLMHRNAGMRGAAMIVEQFRQERQMLAAVDHPNIAKLFDGGATDDGQPYFVMEFVDGVPIDDWCDEHKPDVETVLKLFLQVCAAVEAAHNRFIVHRDLKPGNILVSRTGVPKLLDFGIAKWIEPGYDEASEMTRAGLRMLTPEYASPEHMQGLPVSASSDVYSLGVILYRLLSGVPPYRFPTDSPTEIEQIISTVEPPKPSTVVADPLVSQRLSGDLDIIVLKALEKDPARRYRTAEQFAGDISRHLEGRPILARPSTWGYRASRFARRNRGPVIAGLLVAISLAAGVSAAAYQAAETRRERARAERNFADLRKLTQSFLFDFHDQIKDLPGSTRAQNMVIETAVQYLRRLKQEAAAGDVGVARDVVEAFIKLGDVQGNPYVMNRGDERAAIASYQEALEVAYALLKNHPAESSFKILASRAERALGETMPQIGEATTAVLHLRKAVALVEGDSDTESRIEVGRCQEVLGDVLGHQGLANLGDRVAARAAYEASLAVQVELHRSRGEGVLRMKLGDLDQADGDPKAALEKYRAAVGPMTIAGKREAAMIHRKMGNAYQMMGDLAKALDEYSLSSNSQRERMLADPDNAQAKMDFVLGLRDRASVMTLDKQWAPALKLLQEALAILKPMADAQPQQILLQSRSAVISLDAANLLVKLKQDSDGRRLALEGLRALKRVADRTGATADDLASYSSFILDPPLKELANIPEAVAYARRSVELSKSQAPEHLDQLSASLAAAGNKAEAIAVEEKALALLTDATGRKAAEQKLALLRSQLRN